MRDDHLDRWVRFHALPESKRYAETAEETAEILRRANILGGELFGQEAACWLVSATHVAGDVSAQPWPGLSYAFDARDAAEDQTWAIYAALVQWRAAAFDELLNKIANDDVQPVLWMNARTGVVFAPYDGGFDMVFPTVEQAKHFREFKPDWRSSHPGGW